MKISEAILCVFAIWLVVSSIVFGIRHPWATNMEYFTHIKNVLLFQEISYLETRKNYK